MNLNIVVPPQKKRILVLDLFSGIWSHSSLLTKALAQLEPTEFEITYLTCGSILDNYCTMSESKGRKFTPKPFLRNLDCTECVYTAGTVSDFLRSKSLKSSDLYYLSDYYLDTDTLDINYSPENLIENLDTVRFQNIPVLKIALFDTILRFKKLDVDFNQAEMSYLRLTTNNVIKIIQAGKVFLNKNNKFDSVICMHPEYSANHAFLKLVDKYGIPIYAFRNSSHPGEVESHLFFSKWKFNSEHSEAYQSWKGFDSIDIGETDNPRIRNFINQLQVAVSPFVYSSPNKGKWDEITLRKYMNISFDQKVLLLSLSSTDEVIASQAIEQGIGLRYPGTVFKDQFEWVQETIEWVKKRQDLFLIVRLHPRDLPNKREGVESEQYGKWLSILDTLPVNVYINSPIEQISFSEICSISKVLITGWSSTAIEALLMGKPVITYDSDLPGYPKDLQHTGKSIKEYFRNIDRIVNSKQVPDYSIFAKKWLVHLYVYGTLELTGRLFHRIRSGRFTFLRKLLSAIDRYFYFIWRPFEIRLTFKKSKTSNRLNTSLRELKDDLYFKFKDQ